MDETTLLAKRSKQRHSVLTPYDSLLVSKYQGKGKVVSQQFDEVNRFSKVAVVSC